MNSDNTKKEQPKWLRLFWLFSLLATPIVLWLLPADFFDSGNSICPSYFLFKIECLGCGMSRAVMHLHHFNFDDAAYFNRGSFVIYPLLVIVWFIWVKKALQKANILLTKK